MPNRRYIGLMINEKLHEIEGSQAFMMLADYLRSVGLCGTKIVCAEGDCGACSVLCHRPVAASKQSFVPINSCIALLAALDGCHIVTIEGIKEGDELSVVQRSMVSCHASQCGYCTPGFVIAMTALLEDPKPLSEQRIKNGLSGNLCRCTGYKPIIEAGQMLNDKASLSLAQRYLQPNKCELLSKATKASSSVAENQHALFIPKTLNEALVYKAQHPEHRVISGGSDFAVGINKNKYALKGALMLNAIEDLYELHEFDERIMVGANVSLEQLRIFTKERAWEFSRFLNIFASPQIKQVATLVGNVANGSPIADTVPFLMVSDAVIHCESLRGTRSIAMQDFYRGYKKTVLDPDEIITHISFVKPKATHVMALEKISQRRDLDIATINAAFCMELSKNSIKQAKLAFGGVFATVIRVRKTENYLCTTPLSELSIDDAIAHMQEEIAPLNDLRASASFRRVLAANVMRKFLQQACA